MLKHLSSVVIAAAFGLVLVAAQQDATKDAATSTATLPARAIPPMVTGASAPFAPIDNRFAVKTFADDRTTVGVYEDAHGIMPTIRTKDSGDAAEVIVFYNDAVTFDGKRVKLLRSKTASCPLVPPDLPAVAGCDYIEGIRLSDVAWVKVRIFRVLVESEIGRPQK